MKYEIISDIKLDVLEENNSLNFICPKNSEGVIHLLLEHESNFNLIIEENAHWTINVEYFDGNIIVPNDFDVIEL